MTARPMIFSAPMVRAILENRKSMTRRVLKPQPDGLPFLGLYGPGLTAVWGLSDPAEQGSLPDHTVRLPYMPGDEFWVREAWRTEARFDPLPPRDVPRGADVSYEADYDREPNDGGRGRFRPGMFLPRWASRITLRVKAVKVERLQEISEEDAMAEGVIWQEPTQEDHDEWAQCQAETGEDIGQIKGVWIAPGTRQGYGLRRDDPRWGPTAACAFRQLWNSINGDGSWDANPWVAAYTFERVKP